MCAFLSASCQSWRHFRRVWSPWLWFVWTWWGIFWQRCWETNKDAVKEGGRGGGRDGDYFFPSSAPLSISHRSSSHPEQDFFPEDMAASDWAVYCKVDFFCSLCFIICFSLFYPRSAASSSSSSSSCKQQICLWGNVVECTGMFAAWTQEACCPVFRVCVCVCV